MPKVKITEVDNTGAVQLASTANVVYIPGVSSSGSNVAPKLYTSTYQFDNDKSLFVEENSFKLAHRLLELGMQVLFEGCVGTSVTSEEQSFETKILEDAQNDYEYFKVLNSDIIFILEENTVKFKLTESSEYQYVDIINGEADFTGSGIEVDSKVITGATFDFIANKVSYTREVVTSATSINEPDWNRLSDVNEYDIRFLTTGAYAISTNKMLNCAVKRGDCTALVDHSKLVTTVAGVRSAIESVVSSSNDKAGDFSAAFTPWLKLRLSDNSEDVVEMPGSAGYLLAYARSAQTNPSWYAAAGSYRGVIPGLVEPLVSYSKADCEQLQARASTGEVGLDDAGDNVGIAINPICYIRPFGVIVYGNRTLRDNKEGEGTKATSFLNVRNCVNTLKKELYFASNKYTFEQNSEVLWINFKSQITPLLDKMQSGNGIEGYKIVRLATNAKARLKARVVIIPIEAVEDFELEVYLEDSLEVVEQ